MTRDDIIKMACEADAGFHPGEKGPLSESICGLDQIIRFAHLVAAAEREACAKVCEARYMGDNNREDMEAKRIAEAIRARGES